MKRLFCILAMALIISIINIVVAFAEEIDIRELSEDKSVIILNENNDNSEIINRLDNTILISDEGNIISIPKEDYSNFQNYKLLGYENNNTYYLYSNAKNLVDEICDTKDMYLIISFIVALIFMLIFSFASKYFFEIGSDELSVLMIIIMSLIFITYAAGATYIDNLKFGKLISSQIEKYVEPEEVLE